MSNPLLKSTIYSNTTGHVTTSAKNATVTGNGDGTFTIKGSNSKQSGSIFDTTGVTKLADLLGKSYSSQDILDTLEEAKSKYSSTTINKTNILQIIKNIKKLFGKEEE